VNMIERVTLTVPETLYVVPRVSGLTALEVGQQVGDSTLAAGFAIAPADSGYTRRGWQVQFYTSGPVRSVTVDSIARITFSAPPPPACRFFCQAKVFGVGVLLGAGAIAILK